MKINGKKMLKTMVEGLLDIPIKLAFVMDSMALVWLYLVRIEASKSKVIG
jgi:hypothetical protein